MSTNTPVSTAPPAALAGGNSNKVYAGTDNGIGNNGTNNGHGNNGAGNGGATTAVMTAPASTTVGTSTPVSTTAAASTTASATTTAACGNGGGGGAVTRQLQVTLPVAAYNGPAVELMTTSVGPVTAGTAAWVSVYYKANKPGVTDARLTVVPPSGASVTYPSNGTSTGFAAGADLSVGATDYASFKIDTGSLKAGNYTLGLNLAYGNGTQLPGSMTLAVS